jgi:hypothetical protein
VQGSVAFGYNVACETVILDAIKSKTLQSIGTDLVTDKKHEANELVSLVSTFYTKFLNWSKVRDMGQFTLPC